MPVAVGPVLSSWWWTERPAKHVERLTRINNLRNRRIFWLCYRKKTEYFVVSLSDTSIWYNTHKVFYSIKNTNITLTLAHANFYSAQKNRIPTWNKQKKSINSNIHINLLQQHVQESAKHVRVQNRNPRDTKATSINRCITYTYIEMI